MNTAFAKGRDQISYELFMDALIEQPNESRKRLVKNIFTNELDRNRNGYLALSILKSFFRAKNHPDVRMGKLTEEEVLQDFMDTFKLYIGSSQKVNREDFERYYAYVSFCVPDDKKFESLLIDVWSIPKDDYESPSRRKPYHTHGAPYGVTDSPIDYGKPIRSREYETKAAPEIDDDLIYLIRSNVKARGVRAVYFYAFFYR